MSQQQMPMEPSAANQVEAVLSYAISQFLTKATENPVQRLLLIMTVHRELVNRGWTSVSGVVPLVKSLWQNEGLYAPFRGLLFDTAFSVPSFANDIIAQVATGQILNQVLMAVIKNPEDFTPTLELLLTLAQSSMVMLLTIPTAGVRETVMTHLHCDMRPSSVASFRYTGAIDCMKRIYRGSGLKGFYQGALLGTASMLVYRGFYYTSFTALMRCLNEATLSRWQIPLAFGLTLCCGAMTQPFEVIRRRMMLAVPVSPRTDEEKEPVPQNDTAIMPRQYNGVMDCVKQVVEEEGYRGLFAGLGVRVCFSCVLLCFRVAGSSMSE